MNNSDILQIPDLVPVYLMTLCNHKLSNFLVTWSFEFQRTFCKHVMKLGQFSVM